MSLLKGTGEEEVRVNCEAFIPRGDKPGKMMSVKFIGVYRAPADMDEVRRVMDRLRDEDDEYGDEEFVSDYFITFEKMPAPDGSFVDPNATDESGMTALELALNHRDYFIAIAKGCSEAVFGKEGRRKN